MKNVLHIKLHIYIYKVPYGHLCMCVPIVDIYKAKRLRIKLCILQQDGIWLQL